MAEDEVVCEIETDKVGVFHAGPLLLPLPCLCSTNLPVPPGPFTVQNLQFSINADCILN